MTTAKKYDLKPGDRVTISRSVGPDAGDRVGTLEMLQGSYALVVWDDRLGPYRAGAHLLERASRTTVCTRCGEEAVVTGTSVHPVCARCAEEEDYESCPTCGSRPGDGYTAGCEDEVGCGLLRSWKELHK